MEDVNTLPGNQTKQEPGYDIPLKKSKIDESQLTHYLRELYSPAALLYQFSRQQPWITTASPKLIVAPFGQNITSIPTYLPSTQEPPILQNPERVVRHTENERFDRSYQPNVALAPRQTILAKEREREQRDYEKDRESNERSSTVIKRETIQIKQERPSTPNEQGHNSPETTVVLETTTTSNSSTVEQKHNVTAPISPEGQSGSNEITSSTSPVPVTPSMIPNKQESISPSHRHTTSPRSHHLHHHTMISSHHHHHLIHKTSSSSSSSTSASPPTVVVKVTTNHQMVTPLTNGIAKKIPLLANPEFELSTDTDDESLGEPDSSNHNGSSLPQTPYDFVASLLKTNSTDDHSKILELIKYMEKQIIKLKEAHKKEMSERQHVEETLRKENERLLNQMSQQQAGKISTVIANAPCHLSSSSSSSSSSLSSNSSYDFDQQQQRNNNNSNNSERRNSIVEKPNVIIKPPKKSLLRITPLLENDCKPTANNNNTSCNNKNNNNNPQSTTSPSIVIMPKCEDIMNNNNTKIYNNNNNSTSTTTTTVVINGQATEASASEDASKIINSNLQKTTIKAEKL